MGFVAKIYPNGEFTAGECHVRRLKSLSGIAVRSKPATLTSRKRYFVVPDTTSERLSHGLNVGDNLILHGVYSSRVTKVNGSAVTLSVSSATGGIPYEIKSVPEFRRRFPLGLSLVQKFPHTPDSRISKYDRNIKKFERGIRPAARRHIRNYCYLLEEKYGKHNLGFLTLTLPSGYDDDQHEAILAHWSKIKSQFLRRFTERLKRKGVEPEYVCVTELQEKRAAKFDGLYPHLHIVFRGRANSRVQWAIGPTQCRKIWLQAIIRVCNLPRPTDSRAVENLQVIKRSSASYLSKYLSKGCGDIRAKATERINKHLSILQLGHWYTVSQNLAKRLRRLTVRISDKSKQWKIAWCLLTRIHTIAEMGYTRYSQDGIIYFGDTSAGGEDSKRGLAWSSGRFSETVEYPRRREGDVSLCSKDSITMGRRTGKSPIFAKVAIDWEAIYSAPQEGYRTVQNIAC